MTTEPGVPFTFDTLPNRMSTILRWQLLVAWASTAAFLFLLIFFLLRSYQLFNDFDRQWQAIVPGVTQEIVLRRIGPPKEFRVFPFFGIQHWVYQRKVGNKIFRYELTFSRDQEVLWKRFSSQELEGK